MTDPRPERRRTWNLDGFAIALIAIGALLLTLCGSCTGFFAGSALWDMVAHRNAGALSILFVAGVIGGIPTAGGVVLLVSGIGRARRGRKAPPPSTFD